MLYSGHVGVAYTFSWNHETNGLKTHGGHFFMINVKSLILEKSLYSRGYKETCSATIAGLQIKRY